jgi:hypothetical protein
LANCSFPFFVIRAGLSYYGSSKPQLGQNRSPPLSK